MYGSLLEVEVDINDVNNFWILTFRPAMHLRIYLLSSNINLCVVTKYVCKLFLCWENICRFAMPRRYHILIWFNLLLRKSYFLD